MTTEIAFFTPTTKSGTANFLDAWNCDLWDGLSDLDRCVASDAILFKADKETWAEDFDTENPNGYVQGTFSVNKSAYYLISAKLSSQYAWINLYIDDENALFDVVIEDGKVVAALAFLSEGSHSVTIRQLDAGVLWIDIVDKDLWFHSLKVEQLD